MKRGRPNTRSVIQTNVLEVLSASSLPMTSSSLRRIVSKQLGKEISWNTVKKYVNELVQLEKLQRVVLPHSKEEGKDGLIVYMLKK